jgi:hypothetical protein
MNFKQYFFLTESKEEKALALELAGDQAVYDDLNAEIPQGQKDTDKLLLLAAYYYSQEQDLERIKKDINDYVELLKNNKMPLINVDLKTKKPSKDYLTWTQDIHGHQAESKSKELRKFKPSEVDVQNEKPILTSTDGKIKVYKANSARQCIVLGRGQSFCISQPGNPMWKSYRDTKNSSFYFVYDDSRDDDLSVVVVDKSNLGTELTDRKNTTGRTQDPYTGERTQDPSSYLRYLKEKGIDIDKITKIPKSTAENEEEKKLGKAKKDLEWFKTLTHDEKSNYIGRGHPLTNEQFDYIWNNKFSGLLEQYVKTGLRLNDYQIDKIKQNVDLKKNYIHNRFIAQENHFNFGNKEWELLDEEQKANILNKPNLDIYAAARSGVLEIYDKVRARGLSPEIQRNIRVNDHHWLGSAITGGNLDIIKKTLKETNHKAKTEKDVLQQALYYRNPEIIKTLIEGSAPVQDLQAKILLNNINHFDYYNQRERIPEELQIVKYLLQIVPNYDLGSLYKAAAAIGSEDIVNYLLTQQAKMPPDIISSAYKSGNIKLVDQLLDLQAEMPEYVDLAGGKDMLNHLVEKGAKIDMQNVLVKAAQKGDFDLIEKLIEKYPQATQAIPYVDNELLSATIFKNQFEWLKFFHKNGAKLKSQHVDMAAATGNAEMVQYVIDNITDHYFLQQDAEQKYEPEIFKILNKYRHTHGQKENPSEWDF